ncbi:rab11 family-interacting protein 4B isoform X6 [Bactrocera oleae]|uniref:rab11 family-interacting protein 4B isoform X6 n=1 Tax=Bactrocera oleae TaxID=104688 RepID=UPI0006B7D85B|nr:rab11 family-interacting protein 3 isoform X6 [Bactrocera oleae]XP_036214190.1 rab11 family-interacting protein 3 isoform X6 [Bactrocera oleae]XP_036214191.1 rab11 family-interacting protein 3 isoform X6 [Bactrocera oleae]XP_036214192.1 rab11 family-interacting protein 3 isoform X6 [Bactrocera oleae]
MAPMPSMKGTKPNGDFLYVEAESPGDSSPTPSTPPSSTDAAKSQCSSLSDGESYEGYGENAVRGLHQRHHHHQRTASSVSAGLLGTDVVNNNNSNTAAGGSSVGGVELELAPHDNAVTASNNDDELSIIPRDNWARMSLRRTTTSSSTGRRQLGSNALASQLYRSSSFNSSGRSSNCDTTEDMYSDISLDNVQDLNYKLELLQRQVTDLADTQNIAEDRTTRTKTEYAVLQTRYHMLEEQYRESELRAEERLAEEQKRYRELLARVEREAALQNENCQIKIKTIELEANTLREDAQRLRVLCDKQANDLHRTEEKYELARDQIVALQQDLDEAVQRERKYEDDKKAAEELMLELSKELERLRAETGPALPTTSPETIRLEELHQELEEMRQKNKALEEQNEELQAQVLTRGVEEGRNLLNGTLNSLAQELEEMSQAQDSVDSATLASLSQLQQAFQEKEDENTRLKHYIDTILLNIVENYPQLLEVKPIAK